MLTGQDLIERNIERLLVLSSCALPQILASKFKLKGQPSSEEHVMTVKMRMIASRALKSSGAGKPTRVQRTIHLITALHYIAALK
jgi:hypothetical protein